MQAWKTHCLETAFVAGCKSARQLSKKASDVGFHYIFGHILNTIM